MAQTIEQRRGRQAWENIQEIKDSDKSSDKSLEKKYRALARGMNAMIQINGLGQTLGFLKAKGKSDSKNEHYLLLAHLTKWMQDPDHFKAPNIAIMTHGHDGLLRWVTDSETSSSDYRRATTEVMAFGAWLRRFAEAEMKEPEPGEEQ